MDDITANDPRLTKTSVIIRIKADDGYSAKTEYADKLKVSTPETPLLDGIEEVARLLALYGYQNEARERVERAFRRVDDFNEKRKAQDKIGLDGGDLNLQIETAKPQDTQSNDL